MIVRRLVDAAVMPDLLAIETAAAFSEAAGGDAAAVFVRAAAASIRVVATHGMRRGGRRRARALGAAGSPYGAGELVIEPLGHDGDEERLALVASPRPIGHAGDHGACG